VDVVAIQTSVGSAEQDLREHRIDALIIYPNDFREVFDSGKQSIIQVEVSIISPTDMAYAGDMAGQLTTLTNQMLIASVVAEGEAMVFGPNKVKVPPEVVAAPMRTEIRNLAPVAAGVVPYFGPALLILILQHLCVTLVAMSLLRERLSGIFELYRVGPTNAWEIIAGKLIAFAVIASVIAAATVAFMVLALKVPLLASVPVVALIIGLLIFASIGLGLFLGVAVDTERGAVQGSLLLLLASVFFSGFFIGLSVFLQAVQIGAWVLPATHGIALLQNAMLFGTVADTAPLVALAVIGFVSVAMAWILLRRSMAAVR
jgi:ABC-2 type transport system permease protein